MIDTNTGLIGDKKKAIINKINELYITTRFKYLAQFDGGIYATLNSKENKKHKSLHDGLIYNHLIGKSTIGVFGGSSKGSKFICFDVDQEELIRSKILTYRLYNTLVDMNIPENKIYISFSGSKGYHIEIFFHDFIDNRLIKRFYSLVMERGQFNDIENGQIELRPIKQDIGVKLPLGVHHKTKKRCWFVDINNNLEPLKSFEYILAIEKMNKDSFMDIIEESKDVSGIKGKVKTITETKEDDVDALRYQQPRLYLQNIDEEYTLEYILDILKKGIKRKGTRHNCLFMLAKYFKCEQGLNTEEIQSALIEWMSEQDKRMYSTSWNQCLKDIKYLSNYVHDKDIQMTIKYRKLSGEISKTQLLNMMKLKKKNRKLLYFSMIKHSHHFSKQNGVFYMAYSVMRESTGISSDETIKKCIDDLIAYNLIVAVSRNIKIKGENWKETNKYKLIDFEGNINDRYINVNYNKSYVESYFETVCKMFTQRELKSLCPERQYKEFSKYRKDKLIV